MNRSIVNREVLAAADDISRQIKEQMEKQNISKNALARLSGYERKTIYSIVENPYRFSHLATYIQIFKALGMDEITIRWR